MKPTTLLLALVLLGVRIPEPAASPVAPDPAIPPTLRSSTERGIRFEVDFAAPEWRTLEDGDRTSRTLVWPGLPVDGAPGAPLVPRRIVRVAVPRGAAVSLAEEPVRLGAAEGVVFPVAGRGDTPDPERHVTPGAVARLLDEEAARAAALPPAHAAIVSDGIERGLRVLGVAVAPVIWSPATGRAEWASRVAVTVTLDGGTAGGGAPPPRDGEAERGWRRTLVNPDDAARWRAAVADDGPDPSEVGVPERWFDDADGWVKIEIETNGMHALTRAHLAGAGVPVATLDPRTFRLFSGPLLPEIGWDSTRVSATSWRVDPRWRHVWQKTGLLEGFGEGASVYNADDGFAGFEEIAAWVPGEEDGVFGEGDRVVFYALGPDNFADRFGRPGRDFLVNPYTGRTVYWLAWGGSLPGAPLRMVDASRTPAEGAPVVTDGPGRVHAEGNTWYDPSMYQPGVRWEEWFWERLENQTSVGTIRTIPLSDRLAGAPIDLGIRFWGANQPFGSGDELLHHVRVDLDGSLIGEPAWPGYAPYDLALRGLAAPGTTPLRFTFTVPDLAPGRYDLVHLAWIEVFYRRDFTAAAALPRELELDGGPERTVRFAAAAAPSVFDVTDFRRPIRLGGGRAAATAGEYEVAVGSPSPRVLAVTGATFPAPAAFARDEAPGRLLRDRAEPADYVIVTHDDFVESAERLAAWRRAHYPGLDGVRAPRVRVVRVSDVYDEFTWGMTDPAALRYFLEYAYRYWGGEQDDRLAFALFFGDHTYDMRDHLGTGERSFVPSWEDNRDILAWLLYGNVQYVTDDPLARFDGYGDRITDLYLGRITAATVAEAREVVTGKIIASEEAPDRGPWRAKAILVADDICQGKKADGIGFGHMVQTESVDRVLPAAFDRDKIYLYEYGEKCVVDSKPEAKRDLLESWNEGAWLVNYIGHGADIVLADEHVFDQVDIAVLQNEGRYPILSTFSCSVGKFSKPLSRGLGEGLLMAPRGGALVSVAATHLTRTDANAALNVEFMLRLFPDGPTDPVPVGVALMEAKRARGGESVKYMCLGDPLSRISVPDLPVTVNGPDAIERGRPAEFTARVDAGGRAGTAELLLQDTREHRTRDSEGLQLGVYSYYRNGSTLFRGSVPLSGDSAAVACIVPMVLRSGPEGRARAYASGEGWDGLGVRSPLEVGGVSFTPEDTLGPVITPSLALPRVAPGQEIEFRLDDPAGIDMTRLFAFRGILVRFLDPGGLEVARLDATDRFAYDLGSFTAGSSRFTVPDLEPGSFDLRVTAYDNFGNLGETVIRVEVGESGGDFGFRDVAVWPNPMEEAGRVLFSLDRPAEVTAKIYAVSGRLVREYVWDASAGANSFPWDGRDRTGDPVANGVYLLRLRASAEGGGEGTHLERIVVYR